MVARIEKEAVAHGATIGRELVGLILRPPSRPRHRTPRSRDPRRCRGSDRFGARRRGACWLDRLDDDRVASGISRASKTQSRSEGRIAVRVRARRFVDRGCGRDVAQSRHAHGTVRGLMADTVTSGSRSPGAAPTRRCGRAARSPRTQPGRARRSPTARVPRPRGRCLRGVVVRLPADAMPSSGRRGRASRRAGRSGADREASRSAMSGTSP
jgi:hypothetical protein